MQSAFTAQLGTGIIDGVDTFVGMATSVFGLLMTSSSSRLPLSSSASMATSDLVDATINWYSKVRCVSR